jgi:hypothetical protein
MRVQNSGGMDRRSIDLGQSSHFVSAKASLEDPGMLIDDAGLALNDDDLISFPCTFVLCELTAMELYPVQLVGKNLLSIKVQSGNFYHSTEVM